VQAHYIVITKVQKCVPILTPNEYRNVYPP